MATKISELPAGVTPVSTAQMEVNEGGTSKRYTLAQAQAANFDATAPAAVGTAAAGSAAAAARRDHVHAATGAGVTTILTNFGKFLLTSAETTLQAALEKLDAANYYRDEVVVPATAMGAADDDGVCAAQTTEGAGDLLLNGAAIVGGEWNTGTPHAGRFITATSTGDLSGVTFTMYYYDFAGVLTSTTGAGPNNNTVNLSPLFMNRVTRIAVDSAVGTAVKIGFKFPLVRYSPAHGPGIHVNEGTSDWVFYPSMWRSRISSTVMAAGKTGSFTLRITKGGTAKTVTLNGSGCTLVLLGAAPVAAAANKRERILFDIDTTNALAFYSSAGVEA